MPEEKYSIGLDFGTDSVRALIVDIHTGEEVGTAVHSYRRWANREFCDPGTNQYRQHPLDYLEGLVEAVQDALIDAKGKTEAKGILGDGSIGSKIIGIGVDTTGSTPVAVNKAGIPLSLLPEFENDPHAMFILWKDHTAVDEAERMNTISQRTENGRFTQYVGGTYSPEWFWSKILHTMKTASPELVNATYSWLEHCDWIPAVLSGNGISDNDDLSTVKRSRCAAGHKALWHRDFGGLPFDFLKAVDPVLSQLEDRLYTETYTSDKVAGTLSRAWADTLGLKEGTAIAVGAFDAHIGAVGNGIQPGRLSRIVGTSTCDMVVASYDQMMQDGKEKLINAICGQVDGSIIPGMFGLEAGQSAVGDIFANYVAMIKNAADSAMGYPNASKVDARRLYESLTHDASNLRPEEVPLVIDYHHGRRTPNADPRLTGAVFGLTLSTDAAKYFAGLVQGTCYTGRQIMETFTSQGVPITEVIACGGIADKNPYVMQTMADVLGVTIRVAKSDQTCALGAAMFGAVAGGAYKTVEEAQNAMASGFKATYSPRAEFRQAHEQRYKQFKDAVQNNEGLLRSLR